MLLYCQWGFQVAQWLPLQFFLGLCLERFLEVWFHNLVMHLPFFNLVLQFQWYSVLPVTTTTTTAAAAAAVAKPLEDPACYRVIIHIYIFMYIFHSHRLDSLILCGCCCTVISTYSSNSCCQHLSNYLWI